MKTENIQVTKTVYVCDVCAAHFDWPNFAQACETKHRLEDCDHKDHLTYYVEENCLKMWCQRCYKVVKDWDLTELDEGVLAKIKNIIDNEETAE